MSAPRSSIRALRAISKPVATPARRNLHITGVQSAQPVTSEKAMSTHDILQSRALSIAMRRINGNAFSEYVPLYLSIPAPKIHTSTHLEPNLISP